MADHVYDIEELFAFGKPMAASRDSAGALASRIRTNGSKKASQAVGNETPCFWMLASAFSESHSNEAPRSS